MKHTLFFLLLSLSCFSQKLSLIYDVRYKTSTDRPEDINKESMILDFDNNRSIFRDSFDKKVDSLSINKNNKGTYRMGVEHQFYIKKDLSNNKTDKIITFLGVNYLLPIEEKLSWKISSEQKNIGKYKAQKAEVNYGGRNWTAWFTTDVPVSDGPYVFCGLPGLIITVEDANNDYSFSLIEVKKDSNLLDARTKTITIDWAKYEALAKTYYNDPNDLNSKVGHSVTMTDAKGNKMDINDYSRAIQKGIIEDNNPLELNHKIKYK